MKLAELRYVMELSNDLYLWGHLKAMVKIEGTTVYGKPEQTHIPKACCEISPDVLVYMQAEWRKRLTRCIRKKGHVFSTFYNKRYVVIQLIYCIIIPDYADTIRTYSEKVIVLPPF